MSATFSLFERWKAAKGHSSDSAAAAALGVTRAAVSLWRNGRNGAAAVIEKMAKDLGEDPIPVILQAFAEAAKDSQDKKTLGRLARSLGAAALALALLPYSLTHSAAAHGSEAPGAPQAIHYAKSMGILLKRYVTEAMRKLGQMLPPWPALMEQHGWNRLASNLEKN